jgi:hypothetical protein
MVAVDLTGDYGAIYVSFMLLVDRERRASQRPGEDPAALIEEARRRTRRRRIGWLVVALVGGAAAALVVLATSGSSAPASVNGAADVGGLPTGPLSRLHVAGKLAVGRNGALYVADVGGDRVLVRLPDGRFRVVAGVGRVGFSGDGGPAVDAELSRVSDLAFSPSGSLYIADGGRVRVIGRDGLIDTIAGDGHASTAVADGTPARSAALGSTHSIAVGGEGLSIAFSPRGELYVSTGSQILRLTAAGTLATVRAVATSGIVRGNVVGVGPIAIDAQGDIDVAGAFTGWSIWQIAPDGIAREVGFARQTGGDYATLERGPGGAVYGESESKVLRIEGLRLVPAFGFDFPLIHFAFGRHGIVYADDYPGGTAFEAHQQLVSRRGAHVSVLWQESNATPR